MTWLACLTAFLASPASAQDVDPGRLALFRERIRSFVEKQEVAGAVVVVARRDGTIAQEAIVFLDLDHKQPLRKDALFRIASMTKPITAVGIMILVDDGKLKVEDPVEKHLPAFRGQMLEIARPLIRARFFVRRPGLAVKCGP